MAVNARWHPTQTMLSLTYPWQRWEIPAAVNTAAFSCKVEVDQGRARAGGEDHMGLDRGSGRKSRFRVTVGGTGEYGLSIARVASSLVLISPDACTHPE